MNTERCNNCDCLVEEGTTQLVQVTDYWGREVTMPVCEYCAEPVEVTATWLPFSNIMWIYFVDGLGSNRKVIDAYGNSKEEAVKHFREKWAETFNRDVVKLVIKEA